jgi:hypothetical protein
MKVWHNLMPMNCNREMVVSWYHDNMNNMVYITLNSIYPVL